MLQLLSDPQTWISLLTLTALEIVLGIDNIIFISILAGKLPVSEQGRARTSGLLLALVTRAVVLGHGFSGKDLVMIVGGLFLLWKSVHEIHGTVEGDSSEPATGGRAAFVS